MSETDIVGQTKQTALTREQVMEVPCIQCDAPKGFACKVDRGNPFKLVGFHKERVALRQRYPVLPEAAKELNSTDKSLIVYYGFVMLCDSCEAKSIELFGKHIASADIQRMFAHKAIEELKKDGLLD